LCLNLKRDPGDLILIKPEDLSASLYKILSISFALTHLILSTIGSYNFCKDTIPLRKLVIGKLILVDFSHIRSKLHSARKVVGKGSSVYDM
jgi:hypothetical protein